MHVMRGELQGFLENRLSVGDRNRVVRHLLSGCRSCRQLASEIFAGDENASADDSVFWRLMAFSKTKPVEILAERQRATQQWSYLRRISPEQRLLRATNDPSYLTYGLFERLLEVSKELVREDPPGATGVARLALAIAERLDPARYGEDTLPEARAAALAALGNAQRLASEFDAAATSFAAAEKILGTEGVSDPLNLAHIYSLTASLQTDIGCFETAVGTLGRARRIYERLLDRHMTGRVDIQQALAIGYVEPERGVQLLAEAQSLIDSRREPRLELSIRHSMAFFLCDAGRPKEARELLQKSLWLYNRFGDRAAQVRRLWLEAKIHRGLGRLAEAREILTSAAEEVLRHGMHQEYVLMMIDLAEIHAAQGRHEETLAIVDDVYRSLQGWGMHEEGLAVLFLAVRSVQERSMQEGLFRELATYMRRAWYRPQGAR